MSATLGIDIGGTKVLSIVAENGEILSEDYRLMEFDRGGDYAFQQVLNSSHAAIASARNSGCDKVAGVGISSAGPLDPESGTIIKAANLHGWDGLPLASKLSEALLLPCRLENDASCAGLGEALFGAGRGANYMLYLTISTGIGGGIVINGQMYVGANGNAAEFGHMIVSPDGPLCGCGKRGCLEAFASGTNIARRYLELTRGARVSRDEALAAGTTAADVVRLALEGDAAASQVWKEAIQFLGVGIGNLVNAFNPDVIVIGGGVSEAGDALFGPLREAVGKTALPALYAACRILPASRAPYSGALGACAVAAQRFG
jgi:glucokinase